jgi:NCS1 family nucleobase:cation symporter-1
LYLRNGMYEYSHGFNWRAVFALGLGAGIALSGLVIPSVRFLYAYSWFVGFAVSFVAYYLMMAGHRNITAATASRSIFSETPAAHPAGKSPASALHPHTSDRC